MSTVFAAADEELGHLADRLRAELLGAGGPAICPGAEGEPLYLIRRGAAAIRIHKQGHHDDVWVLEAGDLFGEVSLMFGLGE